MRSLVTIFFIVGILMVPIQGLKAQPCSPSEFTDPTDAALLIKLLTCAQKMNETLIRVERHPAGKGNNQRGVVPLLIVFDANLHVVSDSLPGRGNILVGVSEDHPTASGHKYHNASNSFFSGQQHTIEGNNHAICGGFNNEIILDEVNSSSAICGGTRNRVTSVGAISGGLQNLVNGVH